MFLIREINQHNPARVLWQPGGVSSLTTPNFAQLSWEGLGQKKQNLARFQPFSPWVLLSWGSWVGAAGRTPSFGLEQAVNCSCVRNSVLFPSCTFLSLLTPAAPWARGQQWECQGDCAGVCVPEMPQGRADPFEAGIPIPSQDVHGAAGLSHPLPCPSPAANTAPPLGEDRTRTFLTHRAAKPQLLISHFLLP